MGLEHDFPVWEKLNAAERETLSRSAVGRAVPKGTLLHSGMEDCAGLFLLRSGQLRAFLLTDEGREVTLYRLLPGDLCLFSAACVMGRLQLDLTVEAEKDSSLWVVPSEVYKGLMDTSLTVSGYTNQVMAQRFSEVTWLMEQVMWKRFDERLAAFLLEESALEGEDVLHLTHDKIAAHLGTAREVVTRMLRYFQDEGMVKLTRGTVELTDKGALNRL